MKQYPPYEFRFFIDDGHAWLEVPLMLLYQIGMAPNISCYSYMKGEYAYLEEDCDAPKFLAYFTNDEYTLEYYRLDGKAPIRGYNVFWYPGGISDIGVINV